MLLLLLLLCAAVLRLRLSFQHFEQRKLVAADLQ
jgi:hypothetical protein